MPSPSGVDSPRARPRCTCRQAAHTSLRHARTAAQPYACDAKRIAFRMVFGNVTVLCNPDALRAFYCVR
eukprot:352020-Chlamydomonas_euryale.AAC.6